MIVGQIIIKVKFLSILPKNFALCKFLMLVKKIHAVLEVIFCPLIFGQMMKVLKF